MCDFKYINKKNTKIIKIQKIPFLSEALSSFVFVKLCQCVIKSQTKIKITQQHNKSKLKIQNKRNHCEGQNIIVSLQKKIVIRIS